MINNISRITLCEIWITLNNKQRLLVPTLKSILIICAAGGFQKTMQGILDQNIDCIETALKAGLNLSEKKSSKIPVWLFKNGTADSVLISDLIEFLNNLSRGGKPEADDRDTTNTTKNIKLQDTTIFTLEDWVDKIYSTAIGWLGMTHKQALTTNVNAILLALDGKVDFVKKTSPFGSGDDGEEQSRNLVNQPPNPELAAQQIVNAMRHRMREQRRKR